MKTACVWFSCPRDYGKLRQSVARVAQLDPSARLVVVVSHGDDHPVIEGVEVVWTGFDRGRHLTGQECVVGVAETLAAVEAEMVVKLDSDMILGEAFWKDGPTFFLRRNASFLGLYAVERSALAAVAATIRHLPMTGVNEANTIGERAVIATNAQGKGCTLVRMSGGKPQFLEFL